LLKKKAKFKCFGWKYGVEIIISLMCHSVAEDMLEDISSGGRNSDETKDINLTELI